MSAALAVNALAADAAAENAGVVPSLPERRAEIAQALAENAREQGALALKAALGDPRAQRRCSRLLARGAALAAQLAAIDGAMAADAADHAARAALAAAARRDALEKSLAAQLRRRLDMAAGIDAALRALLVQLGAWGELGAAIEATGRALGRPA